MRKSDWIAMAIIGSAAVALIICAVYGALIICAVYGAAMAMNMIVEILGR